jgi:hypothetical protein
LGPGYIVPVADQNVDSACWGQTLGNLDTEIKSDSRNN